MVIRLVDGLEKMSIESVLTFKKIEIKILDKESLSLAISMNLTISQF